MTAPVRFLTQLKEQVVCMPEHITPEQQKLVEKILRYISDVRFGSVTIVIQDGRVVQIEKKEKLRLC